MDITMLKSSFWGDQKSDISRLPDQFDGDLPRTREELPPVSGGVRLLGPDDGEREGAC